MIRFFFLLFIGLPLLGQTPDPVDPLVKAHDCFTQGQYADAFSWAEKATLVHPDNPDTYMIAGLSQWKLHSYDQAKLLLDQAMSKATDQPTKDGIQYAMDRVAKDAEIGTDLATADEAEKNGLKAKAARYYTLAWVANPDEENAGMAAAADWASLEDYGKAALIYGNIIAHPRDPKNGLLAVATCKALAPKFAAAYDPTMDAAKAAIKDKNFVKALDLLKEAIYLSSNHDNKEEIVLLCRIYAFQNNIPRFKELCSLILTDHDALLQCFTSSQVSTFAKNPEIQAYLADAIGTDKADELINARAQAVAKITAACHILEQQGPVTHSELVGKDTTQTVTYSNVSGLGGIFKYHVVADVPYGAVPSKSGQSLTETDGVLDPTTFSLLPLIQHPNPDHDVGSEVRVSDRTTYAIADYSVTTNDATTNVLLVFKTLADAQTFDDGFYAAYFMASDDPLDPYFSP